jgi:formate dehydrogenase
MPRRLFRWAGLLAVDRAAIIRGGANDWPEQSRPLRFGVFDWIIFTRDPREKAMAKVVCVLYDDPVDGYPESYARDDVPKLERYPDGQSLPTPKKIDFKPGELLGSVSGELGLRKFLEEQGHTLVVTSDKDGPDSVFEKELADAEVVISQPFWPAYLTAARIAKAPKLKLAITAGIGSDHVDLQAAMERGLTVTEVTFSNSISVSEHVVMMILSLVRNYIPSYQWVVKKGWNIADCVERSYDLEGMSVGTVAAGRIGLAVLKRLKPFDVKLHYTDRHRLADQVEQELGLTYHPNVESMVRVCDVVTINCPLHPETEHMFNDALLAKMKRGAYLVNTARGKICDRDAIVRALESGQLAGYAGDVWFPQPAPADHPWRTMPHHGMTPHISGTSLSAQTRYAAGTREILECWFEKRPIRDEYLIVQGGKLAGAGAHSYSEGNATKGSEEAARFKK